MAKETNIDSMKYRKSTHLAGVDIETIVADKGNCILTIKEAFYNTNVDVSGNKTSGYFLEFNEDIKPMVVNSGNRKTIALIVKNLTNCTSTESRNIGNWAGKTIELIFDPNVKMMGQIVGGIKIVPPTVIVISDESGLQKLSECKTIADLVATWETLSIGEKKLPTILAKKESLKTTLK